MSEPQSNGEAGQREFEEIATELYRLRPDAFAAARDEAVRGARAEKRPQLARELGALRRPTQSAWLINLLWRDQREALDQFFNLGKDLSGAMAEGSGPEVLRLSGLRRELEAAILDRARRLAQESGVAVTASVEREVSETLAAALAQAEVANEVRTGRMVKPASYGGFGGMPSVLPAAIERAPKRASAQGVKKDQDSGAEAAREAKRRIEEARAGVEAAAAVLAEQEALVKAARRYHEELLARVEELEEELRPGRSEAAAAGRAAQAAIRARDEAEKGHGAALRALERAEDAR